MMNDMHPKWLTIILFFIFFGKISAQRESKKMIKQLVRLAAIEVDKTQLLSYNEFLTEEIEASIRIEPGVLTLYAIAEKENPEHVTIFETYADSSHYKAHIATQHFQKYKNTTLQMVRRLQLIETEPILYIRKPELSQVRSEMLFIRLIKIEIDSTEIENFNSLGRDVMVPGIQKEPGVLVMYGVSEKQQPTHISILEIYADANAYETHLKTPHFLKYKTESKRMIKSLRFIDVKPIFLGAKPQ